MHHSTTALPKPADKQSPHREFPFSAWLWWPSGIAFLGPTSQTIEDTVLGRLLPPEDCPNSNSCAKGLVCCNWSFILGVGCRFPTQGTGQRIPSLSSPLASLLVTGTSQKRAHTLIWNPRFFSCHLENISRLLSLKGSRFYNCSPTGLYIFAYLKSCSLRILEPKPKYWLTSLPLGGMTQVLAHF